MKTGDVVWFTNRDGKSNPTIYRVGEIYLDDSGLPVVELNDFYSNTHACYVGSDDVCNLHIIKKLPEPRCYEELNRLILSYINLFL